MTTEELKKELDDFMEAWNEDNCSEYITVWSERATSVEDIREDYAVKLVERDANIPEGEEERDAWYEEHYYELRERVEMIL